MARRDITQLAVKIIGLWLVCEAILLLYKVTVSVVVVAVLVQLAISSDTGIHPGRPMLLAWTCDSLRRNGTAFRRL
jgi:hypothetical protein